MFNFVVCIFAKFEFLFANPLNVVIPLKWMIFIQHFAVAGVHKPLVLWFSLSGLTSFVFGQIKTISETCILFQWLWTNKDMFPNVLQHATLNHPISS